MDDELPNGAKASPVVLVADDEKEARLLLRRLLEREHFMVEEAVDGRSTIQKALEIHPDLIFMDIQMPGIDGFEAVQRLRDDPRTARIPIIVVSAAAREPTDVARGLGLGAADYLRKPFNTSELLARARSNIRSRQLEERLQQRTEELEALIRIGAELNQELELDELADRILDETRRQLPTDCGVLILINDNRKPTLFRSFGIDASSGRRFLSSGTLAGYVLESGEGVAVANLKNDEHISLIFP